MTPKRKCREKIKIFSESLNLKYRKRMSELKEENRELTLKYDAMLLQTIKKMVH